MKLNKKYYPIIVLVVVLIIIVNIDIANTFYISQKGIYSIAIVTNIHSTSNAGMASDFYFFYGRIQYMGHGTSRKITKEDEGKRYFVQFLKNNPNQCRLLSNKPVPDCITDAPPEGWGILPDCHGNQSDK